MRTFNDNTGQAWSIEITVNDGRRVRQALGVDLFDVGPEGPLARCRTDVILLVDLLSVILTPEINRRELTAEQFAAVLVGDALDRATEALLWGVIDFFPQEKRTVLQRAMEKTTSLMSLTISHSLHLMEEGGKIDQHFKAALDQMDQSILQTAQRMSGGTSSVTADSSA